MAVGARWVLAWRVASGLGGFWHGTAVSACCVRAGNDSSPRGLAWHGSQGKARRGLARCGLERRGSRSLTSHLTSQAWPGWSGPVGAKRVVAWQSSRGGLWHGLVRFGRAWQSRFGGGSRRSSARCGEVSPGSRGWVGQVQAGPISVRLGKAWTAVVVSFGESRRGLARCGMAVSAWHGVECLGGVGLGWAAMAGPGSAGLGIARQGPAVEARCGKAKRGKSRRGAAVVSRRGLASRGEAWHGAAVRASLVSAVHGGHGAAWQSGLGAAGLGAAGLGGGVAGLRGAGFGMAVEAGRGLSWLV